MFYFVVQGLLKWISPPPLFPFSGLPADDQRRRSGASQLPPSLVLSFLFFTLIRTPKPTKPTFNTGSGTSSKATSVCFLKKSLILSQVIEHDDKHERRERDTKTITTIRSPLARSLARYQEKTTHTWAFFSPPTTENFAD